MNAKVTDSSKEQTGGIDDFDVLDFETKHRADEGVFMPFKHPKTGEELTHKAEGDKAPRALGLTLKGGDSADAKRVFRQLQMREKRRGENYTLSNADVELDTQADAKGIAKLVISGLLFSKGKWVELDKDNAADYLYKVDPLRKQAVRFVIDEGNYLAD